MTSTDNTMLLENATTIIAAYVTNNTIPQEHLPTLIAETFQTLAQAGQKPAPTEELKPAVPIKRSVQQDYIVCLEDGKKFKSLKRHLMTHYNMTPQEYREKWGLSHDYPMVAPNYAQKRSELAKKMGLGQRQEPVAPAKATKPAKTAAKSAKKAPATKKSTAKRAAAAA